MAVSNKKRYAIIIINTIAYVVMIAVNILANMLPIGGKTTGEISALYPNLFTPAPYTFGIWGVIYVLLALFVLYQFGLFGSKRDSHRAALLRDIGLLFALSSVANALWLVAWHYGQIATSVLLMLFLLITLIAINTRLRGREKNFKEWFFVRLPFSIYFGWITVATIANITTLLVALEWDGFGLSDQVWTVIVLALGTLIAATVTIKQQSIAYALAVIWAYVGILVQHLSADGFDGAYPAIIITASVGIALLVIASIVAARNRRRSRGLSC